ncbi:hypothetical protein D3C87_965910 [compost metagenome]
MRQPVGLLVEFAIAEGLAGKHQGRGLRGLQRLGFEALVDRAHVRPGLRGAVETFDLLRRLYSIEQAQAPQWLLRRTDHGIEQRQQTCAQGFDGLGAEQRRVVVETQVQAFTQFGGNGQGEAGLVVVADAGELQRAGVTLLQRLRHRIVFEHQQRVEQRFARVTGPALHIRQRRVFDFAQPEVERLDFIDPLADGALGVRCGDHRQGVDEQTDLLLDALQLARTPRHRGAERHRLLPGVTLQQQQPRRLQQGVWRDAGLTGEPAQALGGRAVQAQVQGAMSIVLHRHRPRQGAGQSRRLGERLQLLQPERFARGAITAAQPGHVIAITANTRRGYDAGIPLQHFAEQLRSAPAVEQDVVVSEDQVMSVAGGLHQGQAQQWRHRQVETAQTVVLGQAIQRFGHLGLIAPVEHGQRQRGVGQDHLQRSRAVAFAEERRAQHFMTLQRLLPGIAERLDVEPLHIHAHLRHVGPGIRGEQAVEQHALLHRRQRQDVFDPAGRQRQGIQLRLIDAHQRHVARGQPAGTAQAMFDQLLQLQGVGIGQTLHGLRFEHVTAEGPAQAQLPGVDLAVDAQASIQFCRCALLGATAFLGRTPWRVLVETRVELAHVVEGDLG